MKSSISAGIRVLLLAALLACFALPVASASAVTQLDYIDYNESDYNASNSQNLFGAIGSTCWADCTGPGSRRESNWLQADPKAGLWVVARFRDSVTFDTVAVANYEIDVNNDGTYDSAAPDGRFLNLFSPSAGIEPLKVTIRATAVDGAQGTKVFTLSPIGMRRVFMTWNNSSRVDLHVWRASPLARDGIGHIGPSSNTVDLRPNYSTYNDAWDPFVVSRDPAAGTNPTALIEFPAQLWQSVIAGPDVALGPAFFPDGYTIGACQSAGNGATVTVTVTELNGSARTLVKTLARPGDGWLVGTTAGGSIIPARGWCGEHDPVKIGAASVAPSAKLSGKKFKRNKSVKIALAEVPSKSLVRVNWKGKGGTSKVVAVGSKSVTTRSPNRKGKFKLQVKYLGKFILNSSVKVK